MQSKKLKMMEQVESHGLSLDVFPTPHESRGLGFPGEAESRVLTWYWTLGVCDK